MEAAGDIDELQFELAFVDIERWGEAEEREVVGSLILREEVSASCAEKGVVSFLLLAVGAGCGLC